MTIKRRSADAPAVIASFGSGTARIDVRVIAPHGAAAYRAALGEDLAARKASGTQLLNSKRLLVSATARRQLLAGQVDTRLLTTIASMAALYPVSVVAFGGSGPGASAGQPLQSADLAQTDHAAATAYMGFLRAQRAPYRAAQVETLRLPGGQPVRRAGFAAPGPLGLLARGRAVLRIEFAAPSPFGLLGAGGNGGG